MPDLPFHGPVSNDSKFTADLVNTYDRFVELQDAYSFLCDAITALMETHSELDHSTLEGMRAFSDDAKQTAGELKASFQDIMEQCRARERQQK